ncbi:hypothetical protein [Lentisalinibacter sediminis]|uniref:hypothetical protein n=1 Tax=Lentisalinibacter sediminis TaxID=2992237 RepID=UPI00386A227D
MDAETLERRHTRRLQVMLLGMAVGTLGFTGGELLEMTGIGGGWAVALSLLTLAGWLTFAAALIAAARLDSRELLTSVVDDERVAYLRGQSFQFGFAAVLLLQVILLVGSDVLRKFAGVELTVDFVVNLTISVGVLAALGRFLYLNR